MNRLLQCLTVHQPAVHDGAQVLCTTFAVIPADSDIRALLKLDLPNAGRSRNGSDVFVGRMAGRGPTAMGADAT